MNLVSVDSAAYTASGAITLTITANLGKGNQSLPYGWVPGDPNGLGPAIDAYMAAHPGFNIAAYVPPNGTGDQVDAERERRIALPLSVTVSVGSFSIDMDVLSQRNLGGLASVGQYLVATGSSQTTTFRDHSNTNHTLTPADLVSMGLQVAQRIQAAYAKSWALKALNPIPADYASNESYWA